PSGRQLYESAALGRGQAVQKAVEVLLDRFIEVRLFVSRPALRQTADDGAGDLRVGVGQTSEDGSYRIHRAAARVVLGDNGGDGEHFFIGQPFRRHRLQK